MRIFFSWLMTLVFAFEPFLQAQAADKQNADALIQQIKASSLGVKGKTYGDLYMFMKMNLPSRFTDRFAQLLLSRRLAPLPDIEFSKFITKEGHDGVKMILSEKGLSHTVEILNEDAMFAKVDGTPLNWRDIDAVTPALNKLVARNPNLYDRMAPTGVFKPNPRVVFNRHAGNSVFGGNFLIPFKENWARMTTQQRAQFFVEIRKTWKASLAVERFIPDSNGISRKSAALLHPFFLNALAIDEAFAAVTRKGCKKPLPPLNNECIHSGFVGMVTMNGGSLNCSHPSELTEKQLQANPKIANQVVPNDCRSSGLRACNPSIYGYKREGPKRQVICVKVDAKSKAGQDVTHWQGACEVESPLDSSKEEKQKGIDGMPGWLKDIHIDPGNVTQDVKDKIRAGYEKAQTVEAAPNSYKVASENSSALLASSLNMTPEDLRRAFISEDQTTKSNIFATVETFYMDINEKLGVCQNMYKGGQDSNCDFSQQLGACQQLFRRKLVMDTLMADLCPMQVFQIGQKEKTKDGRESNSVIWGKYDDAKLETIQQGSFNPAQACMLAANQPPTEPPKPAPVVVAPAPAPDRTCELAVPSKGYTLKVEGEKCLCVSKEDSKKIETAIPDLDSGASKYRCPEEKESSIDPLVVLGIGGAGLLLYALSRDNRSRSGECPANTTRTGDNCYFNPICDKTRYPEVTMVNNQCVLPGKCTEPAVKDANGNCILPGNCPTGSKRSSDGKTCVVDCPTGTKPLANGTCQWGVACPMLGGQIVYDLSQCSEGNGTTQPVPGAGGVQ